MSDVQIAIIDQENIEVNLAVPGIQGAKGDTGTVAAAGDGTAAAPGISFASDTNTGIYRPGADQLAISTGGTGRLFVDANGNVGIGQAPLYGFDLRGTGQVVQRVQSTSASGLSLGSLLVAGGNGAVNCQIDVDGTGNNFGPGALIGTTTNHFTAFRTNNTERLRITSAGLVGIGTSAPSSTLEVNGTITAQGNISAISGGATRTITLGNAGAGLEYNVDGTTYLGGRTDAWPLVLRTNSQPRITITAGGLVGIGTTGPTAGYLLDVRGRIRSENTSSGFAADFVGISGGNLTVYADASITQLRTDGAMVSYVNGQERTRVDTSGRLLVGTASNSGGALLQVNGDRIRVATAKTPASATDTGTAGEICWDANYIYVCTATNTWKRTAIATW